MSVRIEPEAAAELRSARDWYEERRRGLGKEFLAAVRATMIRVRSEPLQFMLIPRFEDVRRAVVERFPYVIVFMIRGAQVHILAIAHQARRPTYWRGRAKR